MLRYVTYISALTLVISVSGKGQLIEAASIDPSTAAILSECRQQSIDGSGAVSYRQQDGVQFSESTSADGERRGSYSYVGSDGRTYSVEYTAGRGGFRIIRGDHVPRTPSEPAAVPVGTSSYQQPAPADGFVYITAPATIPSTTTTVAPAVRRNFHVGRTLIDRSSSGYTFQYTHAQ